MELTREYILRLQKNRQGTTGGGSGTAGTSGNYVTPAQLDSALANKVDVSFFSRLFELYNGEGTTAAKIETNAALPEDTSKLNIKAPFDFWSQRSVSALGKGGSGSSSVFDEAAMWMALGGSIDNKQIALSHLTTALNGYVKGVKVGETTYSPNASGIVDLGTITGRTYAFATGATNGTFKVTPSVGDAYEVAIKGLAALAYKASLTAEDIPNLDATKITTGILGTDRIPGLAASKIVSGTLDAARIPSLSWNKITTDKPTTLAGYGITDAKIENGVITLGANTITPVTQITMTVPTGFAVTGSPLTKSGTLALSYAGGYEGFTTALKNKIEALFSWFELDSDGNVKTKDKTDGTHRGFWTESFVSALGKNDSGGSASVLNEPLQSINTTFSANPSASQAGYAIVWNGSRWTYGKAASDGVDMNTVWNALNGSTGGKQINTAWLTGVTKTLTITSGNTTVVYDGTVARSITINDMAAKQLTASTIDGTAGSFFFYGDNLINNQFDWVGIQVDKASNNSPDRGQLVWDSGSISVRQNDGDSWTDWALVLTNKNYASQIAAGTITNAMLAGSIANSKLANSSVTINGSSVSLGGSITTSKWGESRNINIASSDGTGASTSVSVDGSAAKTLLLPSTIKASLSGNADTATTASKLSTVSKTAWGQTYWTAGGVPTSISGTLSSVLNIEFTGVSSSAGHGGYLDFHYNGSSADYTSRIIEEASGRLSINSALWVNESGYVGVGTNSPSTLLHVNGYTRTNRLYLQSDSVYFELDSSGNVHLVGAGFYSDSFVSALGKNDSGSGGGVTLNEPLASINTSSLGSPSGHTNSTLVYNGSSWVWSNSQGTTLTAYAVTGYSGSFTNGNFTSLTVGNKAVATQEWVGNQGFVKLVTAKNQSYIDGTLGSYAFEGSNGTWTGLDMTGNDWAGLQVGGNNDRWQLMAKSQTLFFRQNDNDADHFSANNWGDWKEILTTANTKISGQTITINGTSLTVPTGAGGDYLPLSGGTLTGILNLNFQSVNASETNNGISQAHVYPTTFNVCDKYGKILTRMEADVESTGDISSYWYVRNYNTSGGQIGQKGIRMRLTKDGVFSYTVDEPDKFLEAIGVNLGNYVAKAGDSMTGTLNINYNIGSAYALNVTGGFNLVSTANSGILNATELKLTAGYGIKMVGGANDVTIGDSSHANAVFSYGGFKKSGSSDSYVLLGGGGHKALDDFQTINMSHSAGSTTDATVRWMRLAIITFSSNYASSMITLDIVQRFEKRGTVFIRFKDGASHDLDSITYTGILSPIRIVKKDNNNWYLYIQKPANDQISVAENRVSAFMNGRVTVTLDNTAWDGSSPDPNNGTLAVAAICISMSGNIGIGTTNPSYKLHVNGSAAISGLLTINGGQVTNDSKGIMINASDNSARALIVYNGNTTSIDGAYLKIAANHGHIALMPGGNVGIGTTSPQYNLHVNGTAYAKRLNISGMQIWWSDGTSRYIIDTSDDDVSTNGTWRGTFVSGSDIRLKDIDRYLDGKLEDIARAPIFSFGWKNKKNKQLQLGTSAQYWKDILPFGVFADARGYLALDYGATALAAAVFTARKVVDHELRIKQLEQENMELREEIKQLKAA